jgi:hypothetical protein
MTMTGEGGGICESFVRAVWITAIDCDSDLLATHSRPDELDTVFRKTL